MDKIKKALDIAVRNLRSCYTDKGIYAGRRNYDDYWARDSFFASFGANAVGDFEIVRKNLELFTQHQLKNGQLPYKITEKITYLKYFGLKIRKRLTPLYVKAGSEPEDPNSLFPIIAYNYIRRTRNTNFAREYFENFEKAVGWNMKNDTDFNLLIEESYYSDWEDSIKKHGEVLYTNVCHCEALKCLANISKVLKEKDKFRYYSILHEQVKKNINRYFWNGTYYIDWRGRSQHIYFSTDGNILAILWGIADRKKAKRIEESIKMFKINKDVPSKTNYPGYVTARISKPLKLIGLGDYHNFDLCWLWLGCMDVLAKQKIGMKKEAKMLLGKIADKIIQYNNVYEVYESNGKPVSRLLYKSEVPFAWSAGLFIYAVKKWKR